MKGVLAVTTGAALLLIASACGNDKHDCPSASFTTFTATPNTVAAGGTVGIAVAGDHLNFETDADHDEECPGGHLHIYLDDLMTNPIVMEEVDAFDAVIPTGTSAGAHTLIIRLHNHDHTIVEPQVTMQTSLTVQ